MTRRVDGPLGKLGTTVITKQDLIAGILAGLVASVVEMIPVLSIQGLLGVSVLRVFQSIAGGLLGAAAYQGGVTTAFLGGVLHLFISLVAGVIYAATAARESRLVRYPLLGGVAAGIVSYLVMTFIVLPLSAVPFPANRQIAMMMVSLLVHIVAFDIPTRLSAAGSWAASSVTSRDDKGSNAASATTERF